MRLIDADKLMQRICDDMAHIDNIDVRNGLNLAIQQILFMPDALKRGYWEYVGTLFDGTKNFSCSVCGNRTNIADCLESTPKYCPECGAKMEDYKNAID